MNKPNYKRIFWDRTLQNFSLAFMLFVVMDITLACTMVSCAKSAERLEMKKAGEDILNTPNLVSLYKHSLK